MNQTDLVHYIVDKKGQLRYLCNSIIKVSPHKMTTYKTKVTCSNCKKTLRGMRKQKHLYSSLYILMYIKQMRYKKMNQIKIDSVALFYATEVKKNE